MVLAIPRACPACGAELSGSSVAEALEAARCPRCEALVDLRSARRVGRLPPIAFPKPERMQVEERAGALRISWRMRSWELIPLGMFATFWNGFMLVAATGVSDGFRHPGRLLWGLLVPHVWVGLWLAYYLFAQALNSVEVEAGTMGLTVRVGPLPWRGNRRLARRDLQQLFVVERRQKGAPRYDLCAVMADGMQRPVIRSLRDELQARFLESKLERALGIEDRPVEGELRRAW